MKALMLLLLINTSWAYDVQTIYARLAQANGIEMGSITVRDNVYGWCTLSCTDRHEHIIVSTELLNVVRNEDELAGVIGHEMAHDIYVSELDADVQGLKYAEKAGYGYCKAAQLMKLYEADKRHPSGADRYRNTGCK